MSWVALAYGFKWLWSPLVDRMPLPLLSTLLGRRRSWMFFSQLLIAAALVGMAFCDPKTELAQLAMFALLVAFASATQDIVIDAYRIESAPERLQAAMAALLYDRLPVGDDHGGGRCAGAGRLARQQRWL